MYFFFRWLEDGFISNAAIDADCRSAKSRRWEAVELSGLEAG